MVLFIMHKKHFTLYSICGIIIIESELLRRFTMKQVIYVNTMDEAVTMAMKLASNYAVMIANNEYKSGEYFEGVMIYVKE